jgi:hypothetical protein
MFPSTRCNASFSAIDDHRVKGNEGVSDLQGPGPSGIEARHRGKAFDHRGCPGLVIDDKQLQPKWLLFRDVSRIVNVALCRQ